MRALDDWYRISFDDDGVTLDVRPEGGEAWIERFRWDQVIRVCFEGADLFGTDTLYVFIAGRPESYAIPAEGQGGQDLWGEIIRRGLFDAELAIQAATGEGLRCWPPVAAPEGATRSSA